MYVYKLLNRTEHNYNTTHIEALAMAFALHKFKHYLLGYKFVFYVDLCHWSIWLINHKFQGK